MEVSRIAPGFGYPDAKGDLKKTVARTQVGWIATDERLIIGLTPDQISYMRDIFGKYKIKNPQTKESLDVDILQVEVQSDRRQIAISTAVQRQLHLEVGNYVEIERTSNPKKIIEDVSKNLGTILDDPSLFQKLLDIVYTQNPTGEEDSPEFDQLIQLLKSSIPGVLKHLNGYMEIARERLREDGIKIPVVFSVFFRLGLGNEKNTRGETPLHLLAKYANGIGLEKLIEKYKLDFNAKTNEGRTPMHVACRRGKNDAVRSLAFFNPDLSIQDLKGRTSLHEVCIRWNISDYKLAFGELNQQNPFLAMDAKDKSGKTAFDYLSAEQMALTELRNIIQNMKEPDNTTSPDDSKEFSERKEKMMEEWKMYRIESEKLREQSEQITKRKEELKERFHKLIASEQPQDSPSINDLLFF
jgi:Ankyrin repeats (many copies)